MAAEVWLRRDIANALMAAYQAALEGQSVSGQPNAAYLAGCRSMIGTLALFFGISPALVLPEQPEFRLTSGAGKRQQF